MKQAITTLNVQEAKNEAVEFLTQMKVPIFATIDHKQNAHSVELQMSESVVLLFGNPALGTHLMNENIEVSFELPLKLAIFTEGKTTHIRYTDIQEIADKYHIQNTQLVQKAEGFLQKLIEAVTP